MFLAACRIGIALLCFTLAASVGAAAERLAGPYRGAVERVVDGDTIAVRVTVWLQQDVKVLVRVRGIDAPELRGRCESEKSRAALAAAEVARLVGGGPVVLTNIEGDKYFGRVLADVVTPAGADLGRALIQGGFARPYTGGGRSGWCEISSRGGADDELAAALP